MRPALSLILFTTLSGLGFGLTIILALGLITTPNPLWVLIQNGIAIGLIGTGLMASTLHLGHPERAWRALSQWRTSWLSREGVVAIATSIAIFLMTIDTYFNDGVFLPFGIIVALLSLATIYCTAMIYASLKTVARWHHPLTPFVFISFAITGGMLLATALDVMAHGIASVLVTPALLALLVLACVYLLWSTMAGSAGSGSTPETATGLGALGEVRLLMGPHSEENWLQHEMAFNVARKHARLLHRVVLLFAIILPALIIFILPTSPLGLGFAVIAHVMGAMVSRWLFFAEAKHTVSLYYGARH